jgi:hypothetical protein
MVPKRTTHKDGTYRVVYGRMPGTRRKRYIACAGWKERMAEPECDDASYAIVLATHCRGCSKNATTIQAWLSDAAREVGRNGGDPARCDGNPWRRPVHIVRWHILHNCTCCFSHYIAYFFSHQPWATSSVRNTLHAIFLVDIAEAEAAAALHPRR